ncbi:LysR family transcriptional regulator [Variovorax sp. J22R133]|uniref:LysR family transcriptional regulator n=1 Tax=Variovorax brevis TaxID=3053503 RepID=UPI0025777D92|nr:LysR family transcriptional regulator [Variovorax sp. J22R133]MDM0112330.1 LysR family transcriptional regulator [Variovorax sp. J22R133]
MPYDLQHLHAFVTIIEAGSLGRAAVALNITQPALSRTIKRLEDQVGSPLFERHSKGMHLTDIGGVLLPHATLLLRESEHASEEINAMRGLAKGTIRVGALGSIACLALPQAIDRVLAKWPKLRVYVVEGVWDRLAEGLIKHEIDLALGVSVADTAEITAIKDCRWDDMSHVVAAMDHPLRRKKSLELADVIDERWTTTPRGTAPYQHMEQVFAAHGLGMPEILVETRSVMMLKNLVAQSGFLSWLPEPMYQAEIKASLLDALPIPGVIGTRIMTAFRRRQGILPGPAVKLLEELRLLMAEEPPASA